MAVKRQNGHRIGSIPYGYDLAADGRTLVENPSEQVVIVDIRSLRKNGHTLKRIAAGLSERGVRTKTGLPTWTHQAVARILSRHR